jgi:3-oxoacyl-[acyl-carrier-protein] synthase-3
MALVTSAALDPFLPANRTPELGRALAEAAERPPTGAKLFYWSGFELYRSAVTTMAQVTESVLARAGATLADVDWFLFHQANWHINQAVVRRLGVDPARCPVNIDRYGNTTSASIPLLLADLLADGRLHPGQLLVLCTFGAGYAWGAAALRW